VFFGYFYSSQFTANVIDVVIAIKAGMVMGAYDNYGLWIWSFGEDGPGFVHSNNSPAVADELLAKWPPNQQRHSKWVSSIAFTVDGKVAASRSRDDDFVLVWDTATGTILRQLDINKAAVRIDSWAWAVAISSSGDWILCAGSVGENDSDD
jgi:WD40 repeat protein